MGSCSSKKIKHDIIETTITDPIVTSEEINSQVILSIIIHKILELDFVPPELIPITCVKELAQFINKTSERSFLTYVIKSLYPSIN